MQCRQCQIEINEHNKIMIEQKEICIECYGKICAFFKTSTIESKHLQEYNLKIKEYLESLNRYLSYLKRISIYNEILFLKLINQVSRLESSISESLFKKDRKFITLSEHLKIMDIIISENRIEEICYLPTNEQLKIVKLGRDRVFSQFNNVSYFKFSNINPIVTL